MDSYVLNNGTQVEIRPIRPDDGERLRESHGRLSPESIYRRFLGTKPQLTAADARYLVEVDGLDRFALVATLREEQQPIVAVARYIRLPEYPRSAEFAIVVGDPYQRQGLASELLARLAAAASKRDVERFRATLLADNGPVLRLLERLAGTPLEARRLGPISEVRDRARTARRPQRSGGDRVQPGRGDRLRARACDDRGVRWKLTVRVGPRVQRSTFDDLNRALEALEPRARELAQSAPRGVVDAKFKRFEPVQQVIARLELAGRKRFAPTVHAGVDVRGDGSVEAYRGRVRREVIDQRQNEGPYAALRRELDSGEDSR